MNYLNIFNETLKELTDDEHLNQGSFSKAIKINRGTILGWTTGKFFPTAKTIQKIADYFHCSSDYLFGLNDKRDFTPKTPPVEFITRFDALEKENKLNDNKIAKLCDIGNSCVAKWRRFNRFPTMETLLKLTKIFNCSLEYLFGREN